MCPGGRVGRCFTLTVRKASLMATAVPVRQEWLGENSTPHHGKRAVNADDIFAKRGMDSAVKRA